MQLEDVKEGGFIVLSKLTKVLRTDPKEIAWTIGLSERAFKGQSSLQSADTQKRLCDLVDVLLTIAPRFGSPLIAYAWYRSEPVAGLGGWTAMQLVQAGKSKEFYSYLEAIDAGVYV
ncbi:MAG: hypothetical protein JJ879_04325 [Sneathiella sp.]|nr:hypothetical protein [Sneathiella sp.]